MRQRKNCTKRVAPFDASSVGGAIHLIIATNSGNATGLLSIIDRPPYDALVGANDSNIDEFSKQTYRKQRMSAVLSAD